jgi:hypothetical protein
MQRMRKHLALVLMLHMLMPPFSWGTIYYVRSDGTVTAANKANAINPGSAITSLNVAQVNAATFADSDQILFSSQGGDYTSTGLIIPAGGFASGTPVIYENVPGETPTFMVNTEYQIKADMKSNIVIRGFQIAYPGTSTSASGIYVKGASSGITVTDISSDMNGHGYHFIADGLTMDTTISNFTGTNSGPGREPIYFFGAAGRNVTLSNVSIDGASAIYIRNTDGLTLNNVTRTNAAGSYGTRIENCSGQLTVSGYTCTHAMQTSIYILNSAFSAGSSIHDTVMTDTGLVGFYISNSSGFHITSTSVTNPATHGVYLSGGSHDIDIEDVTVTGSAAGTAFLVDGAGYNLNFTRNVAASSYNHGFSIKQGSHDITFDHDTATGNRLRGFSIEDTSYNVLAEDCLAENNLEDGLLTGGAGSAVHDVTWRRCVSRNNGTKTSTADGDGITAHAGDYNIFIEYCSIYGNTASGLALVGTSGGHVYNTDIFNNGGNWTGEGGADQVRAGIYAITSGGPGWTFLNNFSSGNYPREVAIATGTYTFDYNVYNPAGALSNQGDYSFSYWQGLGYDIHSSLAEPVPAMGGWGLLVATIGLGIVGLRKRSRSRVS